MTWLLLFLIAAWALRFFYLRGENISAYGTPAHSSAAVVEDAA